MVAAHGGYGVASPWILPDFPFSLWTSRRDAVAQFFASDTTPAARADLLTRYDVKWILLGPGENPPPDIAAMFTAGDNLGYRLYRVA
jgi:hypothetical protein